MDDRLARSLSHITASAITVALSMGEFARACASATEAFAKMLEALAEEAGTR